MKPAWSSTLMLLLAAASACGSPSASFNPGRYGTTERDLNYCTPDGVELKMDVYFPASGGPWPAVIYVHGGGWTEGDKAQVNGGLSEQGYLVVSINYRLYPQVRFPAMIQDVKCAIRSLRAHAAEFNLDPERIGLSGGSAGGHLVALAGLADESAGFDVGEYLQQSSRVQAVLVVAGPADLRAPFADWALSTLEDVFGEEQLETASPVSYISPDDPPFLILHGDRDTVVPPEQAHLLYEGLQRVGVEARLVIIQNADHGFNAVDGALSPGWEELIGIMLDFWEQNLR
jgi:acetyl esterase/lipase